MSSHRRLFQCHSHKNWYSNSQGTHHSRLCCPSRDKLARECRLDKWDSMGSSHVSLGRRLHSTKLTGTIAPTIAVPPGTACVLLPFVAEGCSNGTATKMGPTIAVTIAVIFVIHTGTNWPESVTIRISDTVRLNT